MYKKQKEMKKYRLIVIVSLLLLGVTTQSNAQEDVVDFGDSNIVVVVEQGFKTGLIYVFYDWFFQDMPPLPKLPTLTNPPKTGGGGKKPPKSKECSDAQQEIINVVISLARLEATEEKWKTDGQIVKDDGTIILRGSQEYDDYMANIRSAIKKQTKKLQDAQKKRDAEC